MKRRGEDADINTQQRREEYDSEGEETSLFQPGQTFKKADEEELAKRKIFTVKRRQVGTEGPSLSTGSGISSLATGSTNPFANVKFSFGTTGSGALGSNETMSANAAKSNVGFNFTQNVGKNDSASGSAKGGLFGNAFGGDLKNPFKADVKENVALAQKTDLGGLKKRVILNQAFLKELNKMDDAMPWDIEVTNYLLFSQDVESAQPSIGSNNPTVPEFTPFDKKVAASSGFIDDSENASTDGGEAPEEVEKLEAQLHHDEEKVFETRAKISYFIPNDKKWSVKCTGDLMLVSEGDEKSSSCRAYLRMQNEATGRQIFNASVLKGMKVNLLEAKKAVQFSTYSYRVGNNGHLEKEYNGQLTMFLVKVASESAAKDLANNLRTFTQKMLD